MLPAARQAGGSMKNQSCFDRLLPAPGINKIRLLSSGYDVANIILSLSQGIISSASQDLRWAREAHQRALWVADSVSLQQVTREASSEHEATRRGEDLQL